MSRNTDYFPQNPTGLPEVFSNPLSVWFAKARGLCVNEVRADSCGPSSGQPRLPTASLARPSPDKSCDETALRCRDCGPQGTHQNVRAGAFTALQPECRGPGALSPAPRGRCQGLTPRTLLPSRQSCYCKVSYFLLLLRLFTCLTFANKQIIAWFNKPHIC